MPIPKTTKTEPVETAAPAVSSTTIVEADPINPVEVTTPQASQAVIESIEGLAATPVADASGDATTTAGTSTGTPDTPTKAKRGRKAGSAPAVTWTQAMFDAMRRTARRLSAQQIAAGLDAEVDSSALYEEVKARYEGFEKVDKAQMVSKYKQGLKEIEGSSRFEEINSGGLEHPLYIPQLKSNRSKIDFLAPLEDE
jgi:hypothetical protein